MSWHIINDIVLLFTLDIHYL